MSPFIHHIVRFFFFLLFSLNKVPKVILLLLETCGLGMIIADLVSGVNQSVIIVLSALMVCTM
jgi:hypothetical protein